MKKNEKIREMETRYQRKKYELMLYGSVLHNFEMDLNERVDEIHRWKQNANPGIAQMIGIDETLALKFMVNNYKDYLVICKPWPIDAFRTGVIVKENPQNLTIIISSKDPKYPFYNESIYIKNLERTYGLINVE